MDPYAIGQTQYVALYSIIKLSLCLSAKKINLDIQTKIIIVGIAAQCAIEYFLTLVYKVRGNLSLN